MFNVAISVSFSVICIFMFYRQIAIMNVPCTFYMAIQQVGWISYYFVVNIVTIHVASVTTGEVISSYFIRYISKV